MNNPSVATSDILPSVLKDVRCMKCGKLLAKHHGLDGAEIKCLRCGTLNRVFETMKEQVIITDSTGAIMFVNNAVVEATQYPIQEIIGKRPSELWGGHMPKEFYDEAWSVMIANKSPITLNIANKRKDGQFYNVTLQISPILDTNKNVLFFVGVEIVVD